MCSAEDPAARLADVLSGPPLTVGAIPDAGIGSCVVLPAPETVLSPVPLRHVACLAVLRLDDATVWLLRTRGAPWSPARLIAAARVLQQKGGPGRDTDYLAGRLGYELEISSVAVLPAVVDRVDPLLWDLRRTAVALVMRSLRTGGGDIAPPALAAVTRAVEESLQATLGDALADFHAATDADAFREAMRTTGVADIAVYNFLAQAPHRDWRLQLSRSFPILVRAAATGVKGSPGETIRSAVDRGAPLVRHLAASWGVGAGTVRSLLHIDAALISRHWEANVRGLATLLDALRPEDRPRDDSVAWQHFNRAAAAAERIFRCPPWTSALARMWLRQAARQGLAQLDEEQAQSLWGAAAVASVHRLRDSLALFLELAQAAETVPPPAAPKARCEAAADHYISTRQPRRLVALAERFDAIFLDLRAERAPPAGSPDEEPFWPLLANDLLAAEGTRLVTPLTSRQALDRHGAALDICLGERDFLDEYVAECAAASTFIVGILDRGSGQPLSTAEIRFTRRLRGVRLDPHVVQHTGHSNDPPGARCRRALAEAIAVVRSDAGQQHLEVGLLAARRRKLSGRTRAKDEAMRMLLSDALRRALGAATLAQLATLVRRKLAES